MSDTNHSPVSLAAGSYDYDALKSALGEASRGPAGEYEQNVAKAIDHAGTFVHSKQDARTIPGYEFREVAVPELGVTEIRQVFVPEDAAVAASDKIVDPPAGEGVTEPVEGSNESSGEKPDEDALTTTQTRRKASAAATTGKE